MYLASSSRQFDPFLRAYLKFLLREKKDAVKRRTFVNNTDYNAVIISTHFFCITFCHAVLGFLQIRLDYYIST